MNRRQLLAGLLAPTVIRVGGVGSIFVGVRSANAVYLLLAITIATAIVQQIAAANRGDGGLGAALSAINGKLDLAIAQLATIQTALANITAQIAQIKSDVADALQEQEALRLRGVVLARIQSIIDKQRLFEAKLIGKDEFLQGIQAPYRDFDNARRELWISAKGSSTIASTICTACTAADAMAYGYGLIKNYELSETMEHHMSWLDRMLSKDDSESVEAAIKKYEEEEIAAVAIAKDKNDIAYALYSQPQAELCVSTTTSLELQNSVDPKFGTQVIGDAHTILTATFARTQTAVKGGAILLSDVREVAGGRSVAFFRVGGIQTFKSGPRPGTLDSTCPKEVRPQLTLNARETDDYNHRRGVDGPIWNDALKGARWSYLKKPDSLSLAQTYLDPINNARIKQQFAKVCKSLVQDNLSDVIQFRKNLPTVPSGD
jgi:hypothetical protein